MARIITAQDRDEGTCNRFRGYFQSLVGGGDSGQKAIQVVIQEMLVVAAGSVGVDHDGNDDGLAAGSFEVAGEALAFTESACIGEDMVSERGLAETVGQRAVFTQMGNEALKSANHGCVAAKRSNCAVARGVTRSLPLRPEPSSRMRSAGSIPARRVRNCSRIRRLSRGCAAGRARRRGCVGRSQHADYRRLCS